MEPVRTCVGCRRRATATELLRVVVVDGVLVPDPRRRLPGRGAHLHPGPECLAAAERRSAFRRAFRSSGPFDTSLLREHGLAGTQSQETVQQAVRAGSRARRR